MIFFSYPAPLYEALKAVGGLSRQSVQLASVVSSSAFTHSGHKELECSSAQLMMSFVKRLKYERTFAL